MQVGLAVVQFPASGLSNELLSLFGSKKKKNLLLNASRRYGFFSEHTYELIIS